MGHGWGKGELWPFVEDDPCCFEPSNMLLENPHILVLVWETSWSHPFFGPPLVQVHC